MDKNDLSCNITKLYNDEMTSNITKLYEEGPENFEKINDYLYLPKHEELKIAQCKAQIKMHAQADEMLIMQMQEFMGVLTKELGLEGVFSCKTNTLEHVFTQPSSEEPCQTT